MSRYASNTAVSSDRSRAEIEKVITKYGADSFMYGWDQSRAILSFRMCDRQVKFTLPMPDKSEFKLTETGRDRSEDLALKEWEKGCRQRWRALALVVKAKLEAVESGITTFEDEFLAQIVLPNGTTFGQFATPQLVTIYKEGRMPKLLPGS